MYSIEINNLKKVFFQSTGLFHKKEIIALDNINLKIKKGEIFGLIGPNGAGKTTLAKVLATLIAPTEGRIIINGFDIKEVEKIKSIIGMIYYDERSLYPRFSARQNLEFIAILQGLSFKEARYRIEEVLSLVGLQDKADLWVQNFSSGMKQRLSIARGLISNPDILLMDEPTKGIDPWESNRFMSFVKEFLNKQLGKTIIFTTHNLRELMAISDRIALIHRGKIRLCLDTDKIKDNSEGNLLNLFEKHIGDEDN